MALTSLNEVWLPESRWSLLEKRATDEVIDKSITLGYFEGEFFKLNGHSENGRFYSKDVWEKVLEDPDVIRRLSENTMFGTIGHENRPLSEEDLRNGVVSHIITDMWIDEAGRGMARAKILPTDTGKNLYLYLKNGAQLKPSSRAAGVLVNSGKPGVKSVDPQTYKFYTFDVVIDPGIESVTLNLKENKEETPTEIKETKMDTTASTEQMFRLLTQTQENLQKQLSEQSAKLLMAESKNNELNEDLRGYRDLFSRAKITRNEMQTILEGIPTEDLYKIARAYPSRKADIDTILNEKDVTVKLDTLKEFEDNFGKIDQAKKEIENIHNLVESYKTFGSPDDVTKSIESMNEQAKKLHDELVIYRAFGKAEEVKAALTELSETKKGLRELDDNGDMKNIQKALTESVAVIDSYRKLGAPDAVEAILTENKDLKKKLREKIINENASKLSKEFSIGRESIKTLLQKHSVEDTKKIINEMKAKDAVKTDKKDENINENKEEKKDETVSLNEAKETKTPETVNTQRVSGIFNSFNRRPEQMKQ